MSNRTTIHAVQPRRKPYRLKRPDARALVLLGDRWTLLVIAELFHGPVRFVEIQRRLGAEPEGQSGGISTEQLRTVLNRLVADGLATRTRYREVPPRVDYELTQSGRLAIKVVAALAAWAEAVGLEQVVPDEVEVEGALERLEKARKSARSIR